MGTGAYGSTMFHQGSLPLPLARAAPQLLPSGHIAGKSPDQTGALNGEESWEHLAGLAPGKWRFSWKDEEKKIIRTFPATEG